MATHVYNVLNEIDPDQNEVIFNLVGELYTAEIQGSVISNNGLLVVRVARGDFVFTRNNEPSSLKPGEMIYVNPQTQKACFEPGPIKNG